MPEYIPSPHYKDKSSLLVMLGDVIDALESFQAAHAECADPFIENQIGDLRYIRSRLTKLIKPFVPPRRDHSCAHILNKKDNQHAHQT